MARQRRPKHAEPSQKLPEILVKHTVINGIHFSGPIFTQLIVGQTPEGRLPIDAAAHALWNYYGIAVKAFRAVKENIVYEDEPSRRFNHESVFRGIAMAYGVKPDEMARYWPLIYKQLTALGLSAEADFPNAWKVPGSSH
jgi:hypothetical protein